MGVLVGVLVGVSVGVLVGALVGGLSGSAVESFAICPFMFCSVYPSLFCLHAACHDVQLSLSCSQGSLSFSQLPCLALTSVSR